MGRGDGIRAGVEVGRDDVAPRGACTPANPSTRSPTTSCSADPVNPATAGPVIGAYGSTNEGVRGAVVDGLSRMLDGKLTPEQAVASAAAEANAAIADYNSRIG